MPRASDITGPPGRMKILLFGAPGAGKTEFLLTWPGVHVIDTDHGIEALAVHNPGFRKRNPDSDAFWESFEDEVDEYGIFKDAQAYWDIINKLNEWRNQDEIETIGIDSVTSLETATMNVGMEHNKGAKRSKTLAKAKMKGTLLIPTQADYHSEMSAVEQLFDQLVPWDKHIIAIAHEREEQTDSGLTMRIDPLITGRRLRAKIARWFDEVWYLDVEGSGDKRKRVLITESTNKLKAVKSRHGLPAEIENPTYEKIMKLLKRG